MERALTLKEAAALLGVSYSTVYAHKVEMGFFQVGNQWRIWPDRLKSATEYNPERPARTEQEIAKCQSESAAVFTLSTSAHQAAKEFADRVARRTARKHRSITTS